MQDSLPAGGLRLCRAGVEPAGSLRTVSDHISPPFCSHPPFRGLPDASWAQLRRDFHDVWTQTDSPIAREALERIGALYDVEAAINGQPPEVRLAARQASQPAEG
jgi:hypothetical protein